MCLTNRLLNSAGLTFSDNDTLELGYESDGPDSLISSIFHQDSSPNRSHDIRALVKRAKPNIVSRYFVSREEGIRAATAWADSLVLAYAAVHADYSSFWFQRYFRPQDAALVKAVFQQYLGPTADGNDVFPLGDISIGDVENDVVGCDNPDKIIAYMLQNGPIPNQGIAVLCPPVFEDHLMQELHSNMLDTFVSQKKGGMGQILLHEFLHWDYLVEPALGMHIGDWNSPPKPNVFPAEGYGPYNAMLVRQTENLIPENNAALKNADNYVYFALEAYWRQRYPGIEFDPAPPYPYTNPNIQ